MSFNYYPEPLVRLALEFSEGANCAHLLHEACLAMGFTGHAEHFREGPRPSGMSALVRPESACRPNTWCSVVYAILNGGWPPDVERIPDFYWFPNGTT